MECPSQERWAQVAFRDGSRFSPPPADHGPGKLSGIQPCLEELFGAGILLDNCTLGISCPFQLLDASSEVLFAVQSLAWDEIFFSGSRGLEDFTHGATEIETGSAGMVYVPVMPKLQLLGLLNEASRWW